MTGSGRARRLARRVVVAVAVAGAAAAVVGAVPGWAAPTYRVLIDTDLGGDPDDTQSLFHAVHYSDILKIEGWVSTPKLGQPTNVDGIRQWIRRVDVDYLRQTRGYSELMSEAALLQRVAAGNLRAGAPASLAHSKGAQLIRDRANAGSAANPLYVFVWGRMTTLARALYEEPGIADKIRIISLGGNNHTFDQASTSFVYDFRVAHPNLWWLDVGGQQPSRCATYLGMYSGPIALGSGEYGREFFLKTHIRGHGTTHGGDFAERSGDAFPQAGYAPQVAAGKGWLKEGDSPTILYLIGAALGWGGNVNDPTVNGWGGKYRRADSRYPNYYTDLTGSDATCQSTIWEDRLDFLKNWQARWDRYAGVTDGLKAAWSLDGSGREAAGGTDGTVSGKAVWVAGKRDRSLKFDGASSYLTVDDGPAVDIAGDFTVAAWIKAPTSKTARYLLAKTTPGEDEPASPGAYVVFKDASNKLCYRASGSGGASLCSASAIANNVWQHWAVVKEGATVRFWRDGRLDRSYAGVAANQSPQANGARLAIGRRGNAGNFWLGRIDDLRLYDRALGEIEVMVLGP